MAASSMMCSDSGERFRLGFDFSGLGSPMTWTVLCMSSKDVADNCVPGNSCPCLRDEVLGTIRIVSRSFVEKYAESLELWVSSPWISCLPSSIANR